VSKDLISQHTSLSFQPSQSSSLQAFKPSSLRVFHRVKAQAKPLKSLSKPLSRMSQAAILALFTTLSQEERVETVQSLVALLACPSGVVAASSGGSSGKKVTKASSLPKEKVSRGPSDWTQYVMRVRAETGLKMAEAMAEAKRRRESGDPDAPPAAASKKAPSAASPKPKAASAKKAAALPKEPKVEEEESASVELEEVEVEGQDYLYLPSHENAAWLKEADGSRGAWAGYLNTETGEFDTSRPAPEFEEADE
jgi:hypothetical protein